MKWTITENFEGKFYVSMDNGSVEKSVFDPTTKQKALEYARNKAKDGDEIFLKTRVPVKKLEKPKKPKIQKSKDTFGFPWGNQRWEM